MTLKALALAILEMPESQQDSAAYAAITYDRIATVPGTEQQILGVMTNPNGQPVVVLYH